MAGNVAGGRCSAGGVEHQAGPEQAVGLCPGDARQDAIRTDHGHRAARREASCRRGQAPAAPPGQHLLGVEAMAGQVGQGLERIDLLAGGTRERSEADVERVPSESLV